MRSLILSLLIAASLPVAGRGQVAGVRLNTAAVDTVGHRPAPLVFFFRSLAIPGWGQASLDRKLTGGLFVAFEGLALGMTMKTGLELRFLDQTDTATARLRRAERQDWIVLVVFNHLFSGLEAYVSAHLLDFPRDLHLRAFPGRRPGVGVTIGLPH